MFELARIGCGVYLSILSIMDIRVRQVPFWILAAGGIGAAGVRVLQYGELDCLAAGGAVVGGVFLVVSKITREGFGYGDSLLILVMGIYLGFWELMEVLLGAFLLSALFAMGLLIVGGFDKKRGYPFIPFLLASYVIWTWLGSV